VYDCSDDQISDFYYYYIYYSNYRAMLAQSAVMRQWYWRFIFIASKGVGVHFATNDIRLSSLKFFWWAPEFLFISARPARGAFRPFKVIQGHWYWCQSKAHMWLPISP